MSHKYLIAAAAALLTACGGAQTEAVDTAAPATVDEARQFVADANAHIKKVTPIHGAAYWVAATYINEDSQLLASKATEESLAYLSQQVEASKRFNDLDLDAETARGMLSLKLGTSMPAPSDAAKREELAKIAARMEATYGAGKYCREDGECLGLNDLEKIISASRNAEELQEAWNGWRTISCLLYTSPSPRDRQKSRMPSSA